MKGWAGVVLVATALLAACGSDPSPTTAEPTPAATPEPTAEASPTQSPDDDLPPIVVLTPESGDVVTSPVTISGTANVFEATVSIRIRDDDGNVLAETFTTATCGSGCRGDFSHEVKFDATGDRGVIEVFESSAEDGSALHLVAIPVRFGE